MWYLHRVLVARELEFAGGVMRALIRRLEEANAERDRAIRKAGGEFYDGLMAYLAKDPGRIIKANDIFAYASAWWDHPAAKKFYVVFGVKGAIGGSMGGSQSDGFGRMLLNVMALPQQKAWSVAQDMQSKRSTVVHELTHWLDPGVNKGINLDRERAQSAGGAAADADYYNRPTEWNAYWQMGADKLDKYLHEFLRGSRRGDVGDKPMKFDPKQWEDFWPSEFIANMTPETRRKFDKRLATLWFDYEAEIAEYNSRAVVVADVTQVVKAAVEGGIVDAAEKLLRPPPESKPRKNKKRDAKNAEIEAQHILARMGKYRTKVDEAVLRDALVGTMEGFFTWNHPSMRYNAVAGEVIKDILKKVR